MLRRVDLIGDFTDWEARKIPMVRNEGGVWGSLLFRCKRGRYIQVFGDSTKWSSGAKKIDPLALWMEKRPNTGSIIKTIPEKNWKDGLWRARRKNLVLRNDLLIFTRFMRDLGNEMRITVPTPSNN